MDQHRYSLRAHGRPLPNQAPVEAMLCAERFCLIGEAWIDGVSMPAILDELGPLSFDHASEIGRKLMAAVDSMEAIAGSCPIWWLPPENLFAITGSEQPGSIRQALEKNGIDTWKRTPLRLRLHQIGESLLKGVDLPDSLVDLLHTGSKDQIDARRSAVLLPILWFLVTGERLNWKKPLPWHDAFPVEIHNILEESRRHLVDSPRKERGRLLDRIASALRTRNLELEPFKAGPGPLAPGKPDGRQIPKEGTRTPAEASDFAPGDGFAERLIFPNAAVPLGGERAEKSAGTGKRRSKRPKIFSSTTAKFQVSRASNQSLAPMMLALIAASAVCGIIWGGMAVYKQFSSTINQQVLSETLALAHYTPATTSVSEFAIPRLDHSPGKDQNTGPESAASNLPPVTEATTAEDAIARGDQALVSRQFAIAVAWYMRGPGNRSPLRPGERIHRQDPGSVGLRRRTGDPESTCGERRRASLRFF